MKKEIDFNEFVSKEVKIFFKNKPDPITGKIQIVHKKFLVLLSKKAIKQENKIVYKKVSVKKDKIERISLI